MRREVNVHLPDSKWSVAAWKSTLSITTFRAAEILLPGGKKRRKASERQIVTSDQGIIGKLLKS